MFDKNRIYNYYFYMQEIDFKKSLGQNFIFDKNLLNAIATDGGVDKNDVVLEIGAGAGSLSEVLAKRAKQVFSYEIDTSLKNILNKIKQENSNLTFVFEDFLNADITKLSAKPTRVVANIPYYITTPIIFKLIEFDFKSILVLVQKEVALRFAAKPKSKDYGITSVILQAVYDVKITRVVKKENFTPQPKVDSATVLFAPHNKYKINNFEGFKNFVRTSFAMRRKTLINNLKQFYKKEDIEQIISELNFNLSVRPEEIDVYNFILIFNKLQNKNNK